MIKFCFYISFLGLLSLYSQEIEERKEKNEIALGINLNTHASILGGVDLFYYRTKNDKKQNGFVLEFVNIKHPKEISVQSSVNNSASYTYGKFNHLATLRTLFSKKFLLFHKNAEEGVELTLNTSLGPLWGLQKPYYVFVQNDPNFGSDYYKYSSLPDTVPIAGKGGFFRGFSEAKLVPGLGGRLSGMLDFNQESSTPMGIEVGTQIDAYSKGIEILAYEKPKKYFFTAFVVFYMGIRW